MMSARNVLLPAYCALLVGCLQDAQRPEDGVTDDGSVLADTYLGAEDTGGKVRDSSTPLDTGIPKDSDVPKDAGSDAACGLGGYTPCNPLNNCGCTGTAAQCDWLTLRSEAMDTLACRAPGSTPLGGFCLNSSSCGLSASCFFLKCQKKGCVTDADCGSTAAWRCVEVFAAGSSASTRVCANRCDLASPSSCGPSGDGCVLTNLTGIGNVTTCMPVGAKAAGETCTGAAECKPGHFCEGKCYRRCSTAADCSGGACNPFTPAITVNGKTYGWCG